MLWLAVPVKTQFAIREFVGERSSNPLDRLTLFVHDHAVLWNSLPALHVAAPWFIYRVAGLHARRLSRPLLALTVVIAVSTMAIKIHYLADGLAGVLCAEATFRGVFGRVSVRNTLARVNGVLYSLTYVALAILLLAAFVWL
jgi:membrane-associated phospholipid phosphatase